MKTTILTERLPIKLWLDDIEEGALAQAKNLANLPFAFKHIAIMPDCHLGYGMPIGGVLATENFVIPNAVGVDIGCGIRVNRTSIPEIDQEALKKIMRIIRSSVPTGFSHHPEKQDESCMPPILENSPDILHDLYESGRKQIGTLGGGNHFIEIQKGSDGFVWLMIHSGSRNVGYQVARHFNNLAIDLSTIPREWGLASLPLDTKEGQDYIKAMNYCLEFAFQNRSFMMHNVTQAVLDVYPHTEFSKGTDIHHNYASLEHHFNRDVIVHRKGATMAKKGQIGIIPGSQGTFSYIVEGRGNPESFMSCSHGAGRKMGRKQAQRELNLEAEKKRLDDLGVIHSVRNQADLDEAAGAYKNIHDVMTDQQDLVTPLIALRPLAVVKG